MSPVWMPDIYTQSSGKETCKVKGIKMKSYYEDKWVNLFNCDCLKGLKELPDDSIDLLATDPPYGIGFMGKDWDRALPDKQIWRECLRVLRAGSFAFVMSIPRADCLSRMIISLEDAGFQVNFTPIFWAYASGFPKAQNIGKAVDKRNGRTQDTYRPFADYLKVQRKARQLSMGQIDEMLGTNTAYSWWEGRAVGIQLPTKFYYLKLKEILELDNRFDELIEREEAEREVIGERIAPDGKPYSERQPTQWTPQFSDSAVKNAPPPMITIPATPQAKALDGSYGGFQPKPAVEVIIVAMKPLSEKTFVDQVLKNRKGITWLDDGRIPYESGAIPSVGGRHNIEGRRIGSGDSKYGFQSLENPEVNIKGRFPANLLVSDDVLNDGKVVPKAGNKRNPEIEGGFLGSYGKHPYDISKSDEGSFSRFFDLDKWAQKTFPFLIVPKASKSEKNRGLDFMGNITDETEGNKPSNNLNIKGRQCNPIENVTHNKRTRGNYHPTVKPLKLMSYLITLGSREGDVVLDPFLGSGTTALACKLLGRKCIGIEIEEKYCEIAANRCRQMVMDLTPDKAITSIEER